MQHLQQYDTQRSQLEELEAFIAVAKTGSFSKAAHALGRDASVISKRVKHLEERLAVPLLVRTTRLVTLTEVGTIYYHRVEGILDELKNANREASDLATSPQGQLRISLPIAFGRRWIAPIIPKFLRRYPAIQIDARFTDRFVDLVAEGFDVTLRLGDMLDSSLTVRKVATYRNMLVASPGYLRDRGVPRSESDLSHHDCLGFLSHASWPDWPLEYSGTSSLFRPKGPLVSDSSELLLEAALQGSGVILVPEWLVKPEIDSGKLVEILQSSMAPHKFGIHLVFPPGRLIPGKTKAFADEITTELKKVFQS